MVEGIATTNKRKILSDIIQSSICMKAHYDTWWTFVHDGRLSTEYKKAMLNNSDFIRSTEQAHYTAAFVYLAHLFDKRKDSSSIPNYLSIIKTEVETDYYHKLENQFENLRNKANPILKIRHKLIAHIDNQLSELEVFKEVGMTWNEITKVLHDTAKFVAQLVNSEPGLIGIPRDGRLAEGVLKVIKRLAQ